MIETQPEPVTVESYLEALEALCSVLADLAYDVAVERGREEEAASA